MNTNANGSGRARKFGLWALYVLMTAAVGISLVKPTRLNAFGWAVGILWLHMSEKWQRLCLTSRDLKPEQGLLGGDARQAAIVAYLNAIAEARDEDEPEKAHLVRSCAEAVARKVFVK